LAIVWQLGKTGGRSAEYYVGSFTQFDSGPIYRPARGKLTWCEFAKMKDIFCFAENGVCFLVLVFSITKKSCRPF
jgi:hypothetical protein